MPLILQNTNLNTAVETVLEKEGILPPKQRITGALETSGITIETLANQLANLIYTAKDPIKLKAIMAALSAYGINLEKESNLATTPTFVFNLIGDNVQLNSLFAPPRNYEENLKKLEDLN